MFSPPAATPWWRGLTVFGVVVGFHAAAFGQSSLTVEQLAQLKAATTFLRVQLGSAAASGSGFVVRTDGGVGYVITNHHVLTAPPVPGAEPPAPGPFPKVQVVFDSGTPSERVAEGVLAAIDPERDLAVLRVAGVKNLPAPIDITIATELRETLPVYVCGFPFGDRLGSDRRNPEITINPASVSSIRRNATGQVARVQLTGALNPGNSGGPVVTADGHLVGVAVTTIRGAGIGFAIPRHEVAELFRGRVSLLHYVSTTNDEAELRMLVTDPLGVVTGATAFLRDGEPPPTSAIEPVKLPDAEPVKLTIRGNVATGTFKRTEGMKPWVQVELATSAGPVLSFPVAAEAGGPAAPARTLAAGPSGTALPPPTLQLPSTPAGVTRLSEVNRAPADFAGKDIAVDVLSSLGFKIRPDGYELEVSGEQGKTPSNLRVVMPKDLALQLLDLGIQPGETLAVRLKGTVTKPTAVGEIRHMIAVREVAFVHDNGTEAAAFQPATSVPSGEPTLPTVNRFPEKFVGRKLTLEVVFQGIGFAGQGYEVRVANENLATPMNLEFYTSKDVATQAEDDLPRGAMLARLECKLERISARNGKGVVGVSKILVLNPQSGETTRELLGTSPIVYPAEPKPRPASSPIAAAPAPPPPSTATPAEAWKANFAPLWIVVGGVVGVLTLAVAGVVIFFLIGAKSDQEPDRKPAARPARPKPDGDAPDQFPGFG